MTVRKLKVREQYQYSLNYLFICKNFDFIVDSFAHSLLQNDAPTHLNLPDTILPHIIFARNL